MKRAKRGFKSVQNKKVWRGQFANEGVKPSLRTKGESSISTERVTQSVRMRFNPLRGLTPDRLGNYLDQFDLGFFRLAAITWDKMERRDTTIKAVAPKRKKAVARHGYDILSVDSLADDQKTMAEAQVKALKHFYDNLTCTNAIRPDEQGGLSLLARQMMDAQSKYYAVHEIVWQVRAAPATGTGSDQLTAKFVFCPLWWFEGTIGKLRYLENEFSLYGKDMAEGEWLVTVGEGLMEACSVAWIFKNLTMQDWLAFCEKAGLFIDAATSESPGSEGWEALVEYVRNLGNDGAGVRSNNATITPLEVKGIATDTFSRMVENMTRAMTILWRGGDLGTTSAKDQTGASLQGDESDILEGDDAVLIEETLSLQVSRQVIAWKFGPDAPVLAYLKFKQEQDPDAVQFQRDVYKAFAQDGTVVDVLANQTDLKKLTQDVGLPINEEYTDPYLPVKDNSGALVTGETITDSQGDVIGAKPQETSNSNPQTSGKLQDAIPKPEMANEAPPAVPSDELIDNGVDHYAAAVAHDMEIVREELEAISRIEDDRVLAQRAASFADKLDQLKKDILHLPKSAQAMADVMVAGLMTGLTSKQSKEKTKNS